jgi:hypothetical protein
MRKLLLLVSVIAALAVGAVANPAYGSAPKQVSGTGVGVLSCSAITPALPATISFQASFSKGSASGFFTIFAGPNFVFGNVSGGGVSNNGYSLSGVASGACPGGALPASFTIGKNCGAGVTINYSASDGESGAFIGNVGCS